MKKQNKDWAKQIRKNTVWLGLWTSAWVVTMAIATFAPKYLWEGQSVLTILAIGVNVVAGIGMILANIKYLRGLDEMQRKIQLEAMGITLGVGIVGGLAYSLLDITNIIVGDAEISVLLILMSICYITANLFGQKRYQ